MAVDQAPQPRDGHLHIDQDRRQGLRFEVIGVSGTIEPGGLWPRIKDGVKPQRFPPQPAASARRRSPAAEAPHRVGPQRAARPRRRHGSDAAPTSGVAGSILLRDESIRRLGSRRSSRCGATSPCAKGIRAATPHRTQCPASRRSSAIPTSAAAASSSSASGVVTGRYHATTGSQPDPHPFWIRRAACTGWTERERDGRIRRAAARCRRAHQLRAPPPPSVLPDQER